MRLFLSILIFGFSASARADYLSDCYVAAGSAGATVHFGEYQYSNGIYMGYNLFLDVWVDDPPNPGYWAHIGSCNIYPDDNRPKRPNAEPPRCPSRKRGSVIEVDRLVVGEKIQLIGTSDQLVYMSNRTPSRIADYTFDLPLTGNPVDSGYSSITVDVAIAGQTFSTPYTTLTTDMVHSFTWNGKDNSGNWLPGGAIATVEVHTGYTDPAIGDFPQTHTFIIGSYRAMGLGLGGWTLSTVHYYDKDLQKIFYGSGESVDARIMKVDMDGSGHIEEVTGGTFDYYMVVNKAASEAYLFNSSGRHEQTRSILTGALLKSMSYDGSGRLTAVTDAFANVITITRPTSTSIEIEAPHSQTTVLTLDGSGRVITIEDPMSHQYEVTYDGAGLMATFENPVGAVSTFNYDGKGQLESDSHVSGAFLEYLLNSYYSGGTVTSMITEDTAEGRQTSYTTQNTGVSYSRSVSEASGASQYFTYSPGSAITDQRTPGLTSTTYLADDDRFGAHASTVSSVFHGTGDQSLTTAIAWSDTFTSTDLLNLTAQSETTTIGGQDWVRSYNGSTKTETLTSPEGRVSSTTYNSKNQVTQTQAYGYVAIGVSYDSLGRMSRISQSSRETNFTYNSAGLVSQIQDPLSQVTQFTYDANGNVLTQTLPDARVLTYAYDTNGNLTSIQTAASVLHSFTLNLYDMIASYVAPVLSLTNYITTYTYNDDKQLTQVTRPDSTTIDFVYGSSTGLLDTITAPEGNYSLSYSSAQLTQISAPGGVYSYFGYNGSLPASVRTQWGSVDANIAYTYTSFLLNSATVTDTSAMTSTVSYSYDNDRLLTGVGDLTIARHVNTGQVTGAVLNNAEEVFEYDATYGELDIYRAKYSSAEIYKEDYSRDALGRISTRAVTVPGPATTNYSYVYDSSGRLHEVYINSTLIRTYNYSNNSNRSSVVDGMTTTSATYDNQDRLLTYGPHTFTYNARGELSGRTTSASVEAFTYSYNALHALTQMTHAWNNSGTTVTDTYDYVNDGRGLRVEVSKNGTVQKRFIYDESGRLVAELDGSGDLSSHFVYATRSHVPDYMIKSGVKYLFVHDHVGSVVRVIHSTSGAVASSISYDEFGRITASSSLGFQPFGFAGGLRDDVTGFVRFGVRDYDPETGRWTSKDPILFGGDDTNLYGYVMADPINGIDPEGLKVVAGPGVVIPPAVRNSPVFRDLDKRPNVITINKTNMPRHKMGQANYPDKCGNSTIDYSPDNTNFNGYTPTEILIHELLHSQSMLNNPPSQWSNIFDQQHSNMDNLIRGQLGN